MALSMRLHQILCFLKGAIEIRNKEVNVLLWVQIPATVQRITIRNAVIAGKDRLAAFKIYSAGRYLLTLQIKQL